MRDHKSYILRGPLLGVCVCVRVSGGGLGGGGGQPHVSTRLDVCSRTIKQQQQQQATIKMY